MRRKLHKKNKNLRVAKILALSFLFFISGLIFFASRMGFWGDKDSRVIMDKSPKRIIANPIVLSGLPEPQKFEEFEYNGEAGKIIEVSGKCVDLYYTILIFPAEVDYRQDPLRALYNRAMACPSDGKFNEKIVLEEAGVKSGKFYVIKASQGESGSWYDPY